MKKNTSEKVAVIGGGSWATAIVKILMSTIPRKQGFNWYIRNADDIKHIQTNFHNPHYLSSVAINPEKRGIKLYNNLNLR